MKKVIVIYGKPEDAAAFDRHYLEIHVPLVHKMPFLKSFEFSKGGVQSSSVEQPPHLVAILGYASDEDREASLASPEGKAAVADVGNFASGGVTILTATF